MMPDYDDAYAQNQKIDQLDQQRVALLKHTIIRASAGSGKTYQLSNRYLQLLVLGEKPDAILATTFTRKAAGEILARVLQRLAGAAKHDRGADELNRSLTQAIEQAIKNNPNDMQLRQAIEPIQAFSSQDYQRLLIQFCKQLHRVRISTLDSFFHKLAMSFKHELGLSDGGQIAQSGDLIIQNLRREAVGQLIEKDEPRTLLDLLRRLHHDKAKRGITRALEDIVKKLHATYQLAKNQDAWQCLEGQDLLDDGEFSQALKKLESIGHFFEGKKQQITAWQTNLIHLKQKDWASFLKAGFAQSIVKGMADGAFTYRRSELEAAVVEAYLPLVKHARGMLVSYAGKLTQASYELLHRYDALFRSLLEQQKVLLYSDVTEKLSQDLPKHLDGVMDEIYYRLDGQINHLLLDEFQDTSPDQWSVIKPLAREIVAVGDGTKSFFCVGDTKQAIYGWRGGCAELFDDVERQLNLGPANQSRLNKSFRTSPPVLDCVNHVFEHIKNCAVLNQHGEAGQIWQNRFDLHEAFFKERAGYAVLRLLPDAERMSPAMAVAIEVLAVLDVRADVSVGILVSKNDQIQPIIDALKAVDIRASGEGGHFLTDDPAVQVIVSAMRLADHPGDLRSLFHIVNSPLGKILGVGRVSQAEAISCSRQIRQGLMRLSYAQLIGSWAKELGVYCDQRGAKRLSQLVNLTESYQENAGHGWLLRPSHFADFIQATRIEDASPHAVKVMTIHKSKGLEFDMVVLPTLGKNIGRADNLAALLWRDAPTAKVSKVYRGANEHTRGACEELEAVM